MGNEIVIIGGGPIGCWTALQAKKRDPKLNITVYERHQTYQRDHIMTIQKRSFARWSADALRNEDFLRNLSGLQATVSELCTARSVANVFGKFKMPALLDIRTIEFEHFMKQECEDAGIKFVHKLVQSPAEIMDAHPDCRRFIAADGANSKMRTAVFGEDCLNREHLFPSVDIIYEVKGQTRYLLESTFHELAHLGLENIGIQNVNGKTMVNMRFVVSKEDYDAIPEATFKKPLVVTPDLPFWKQMSKKSLYGNRTFKDDFYRWLEMREQILGEVKAETPIKLTKIPLARYTSKEFAKTVQHGGRECAWFLVGDAAMGMPFYRSINSGLILGSQLAFLLTRATDLKNIIRTYNHFTRPMRIGREYMRTKYLQAKAHVLLKAARPILFHAARVPVFRPAVLWPFQTIANARRARFP